MRTRAGLWLALTLFALPATAQTPAAYDFPELATTPFSMGTETRFGALTYAGGVYMSAPKTALFGGVSGLEAEDGERGVVRFSAVTDGGQFMRFTGVLDDTGALIAAGNLAMTALRDIAGQPLQGKKTGDAEDLTRPPDASGWLVSFERSNRVTAYADPFDPGAPVFDANIPAEARKLPKNEGMEAVAALPGGKLAIGAEDGRIWLCPAKEACTLVHKKGGMGFLFWLTSLDYLPGTTDELVSTWRRPSPFGGFEVIVAHVAIKDGGAVLTELARLPSFVGNVEGIAALSRHDGVRLYLVTDNNFEPKTPTRLLAFDWVGG